MCFDFWRDENAVTAVPESRLMESTKLPNIGDPCAIKLKGVVYTGLAVATGKCIVFSFIQSSLYDITLTCIVFTCK